MNNDSLNSDVPYLDQETQIQTQIEGDDHDYPHLSGYFMAYYSQLNPPISAAEFELIAQVSCFAYRNSVTTYAGMVALASRITSTTEKLISRRRVVQDRLSELQRKGYIQVTQRKRADGQNLYSMIDLRPIFKLCRDLAVTDGWFTTEDCNNGGGEPQITRK